MQNYKTWAREIKGVAGTSGGAIAALMFALSLKEKDRNDILQHLSDITNVISCPDVSLIVRDFGLEDGGALRQIIRDILVQGGLRPETTMKDMCRLLRMDVVFVCHDLKAAKPMYLTAENTPNLPVCDAVFASCCVPLIFTPFRFEDNIVCDGVLSEYIPTVFPRDNTLNILIPPEHVYLSRVDTWYHFMRCMLHASLRPQQKGIDELLSLPNTVTVWHPYLHTVQSIEFRMDRKMMNMLQHCGYIAGINYLFPDLIPTLNTLTLKYLDCITFTRPLLSPTSECESEDDPDD